MPAKAAKFLIVHYAILNRNGAPTRALNVDEDCVIQIRARSEAHFRDVSLGYNIRLESGAIVYGTSTAVQHVRQSFTPGQDRTAEFNLRCLLAPGTYYLSVAASETIEDELDLYNVLHHIVDAVCFEVVGARRCDGIADMGSQLLSVRTSLAAGA